MDLLPPRPGTYFCFFSAGLRICYHAFNISKMILVVRLPNDQSSTNLERAEQRLVHAHHGARIVELATVVWRAEQSYELALGEEFVAVLNDLMRTADQVHIVFLEEARDNIGAKGETDTSVVFTPTSDVLIGVRPQQIAEQAAVGDLCSTISTYRVVPRANPEGPGLAGRKKRGTWIEMKNIHQWVA